MTRTQYTVRIAVALAFVFAAGISVAVVAPQRAHSDQAAAPAVRLPTIVVRPQADDTVAPQATPTAFDTAEDATRAAL